MLNQRELLRIVKITNLDMGEICKLGQNDKIWGKHFNFGQLMLQKH